MRRSWSIQPRVAVSGTVRRTETGVASAGAVAGTHVVGMMEEQPHPRIVGTLAISVTTTAIRGAARTKPVLGNATKRSSMSYVAYRTILAVGHSRRVPVPKATQGGTEIGRFSTSSRYEQAPNSWLGDLGHRGSIYMGYLRQGLDGWPLLLGTVTTGIAESCGRYLGRVALQICLASSIDHGCYSARRPMVVC